MKHLSSAAILAAFAISHVWAQATCPNTSLTGTVRDSSHALVPGATITMDEGQGTTSGSDGVFVFPCANAGPHHLVATAPGFARRDLTLATPHPAQIDLTLEPEVVVTQVEVDSNEDAADSSTTSAASQTLSGSRLQSLADDPDDLLLELQQLAAAAGGGPANATITVDGFQGSSTLPPKSAIGYIVVNPDMFAAQYNFPPFDGGRVEVYTKPGQSAYHGALFATNGSPWENARDPFSASKASLGKQRYGFELTGPIRKPDSDFSLTLEHRSIDDFAVINAVALDNAGNPVNTVANVATPQRLWLGTARLDWQLTPRNTFIASYSANVDHLENVGVGGTALADTGYNSQTYEHMFRLSDVTTASAHFMHEARLSLRWDGEDDLPVSTSPQVQVAGAFTSGGANIGPHRFHELNIEADDDAILTTKNHALKFGTLLTVYDEHQQLTTNFNGTYSFGGGIAPVLDASNSPIPGQTETVTGFEQYRRALLNLAGGTPTAFSNVTGNPSVAFTEVQDVLFLQDDWNLGHGVHIASGVRYFIQNDPTILDALTPRLGISWSPDQKGTWTLHAHIGTFSNAFNDVDKAEVLREDGITRVTSTIYNPVFGNPFLNATPIHSIRQFAPHIGNSTKGIENVGASHTFSHGWTLSGDYYRDRFWNALRSENINSPFNDLPTGPRPGAPNLDVLQMQNSGQGRFDGIMIQVAQQTFKSLQFFVEAYRAKIVEDSDNREFFTPQSSSTDVGEFAQRTGVPVWQVTANGTLTLPQKIKVSADFAAEGDTPYNVTTGFDNNGDGNFNDRPQYAEPGTLGAIATPYGLLVASGGTGIFPRNKGVMPWTYYLDTNLQRAFTLTYNAKAEHSQVVTVNVRSSNVLNHVNVTQVGGVLGSPLFGVPFTADNGRRIEAGIRYGF